MATGDDGPGTAVWPQRRRLRIVFCRQSSCRLPPVWDYRLTGECVEIEKTKSITKEKRTYSGGNVYGTVDSN